MSTLNSSNFVFADPSFVQPKQVVPFLKLFLGLNPHEQDRNVKDLAAKFSVMGSSGYRQETMLNAMLFEAYQTYNQAPKGHVVSFSSNTSRRKGEKNTVYDAHVVLQVGGETVSKPGDSPVSSAQAFANATAYALQQVYPSVKPVDVARSSFSVVREECGLAEVTLKSGVTMAQLGSDEQDATVSALFKTTLMQVRKAPPVLRRARESLLTTRQLLERNFVEGTQLTAM